jgi:hypothetical protein
MLQYLQALKGVFDDDQADSIYQQGMLIDDETFRQKFFVELLMGIATGDYTALRAESKYVRTPVDPETFLMDPYYLDKKGEVYPEILREFVEICTGDYTEIVCTGAIGTGKTTIALYIIAYQVYILSCYRNPHREFGLDSSSEIMFIFQSINETLAKTVDYHRFQGLIEGSPYFLEKFPFNPAVASRLKFPNRIEVVPVAGHHTAALGQNVIGGLIDELNFASKIEKSKTAIDGGTYDQAIENYNAIARRRASRFMQKGKLPGKLCLVSSRNYPGQFTDIKEEEAKTNPLIYIYDKKVWDIKPWAYSGKTFWLFKGDATRSPRIVEDVNTLKEDERPLLMRIPIEHLDAFENDITKAVRDIAGISTVATHPYIVNRQRLLDACTDKPSIFRDDCVDFATKGVRLRRSSFTHAREPRFVHIDLGITSDSAGLCIGFVEKFESVTRGDAKSVEILPKIVIDGVLEIEPPKNGEIEFSKIRSIIYALRERMGVPIQWVSLDSYQSRDTIQILRNKGYSTGIKSVDTTRDPYDAVKTLLYDGLLEYPRHMKLLKELSALEDDPKTGKIDHPVIDGSKDCSDALAGVVWGLLTRVDLWRKHKIPPQMIPEWVLRGKSASGLEKERNA